MGLSEQLAGFLITFLKELLLFRCSSSHNMCAAVLYSCPSFIEYINNVGLDLTNANSFA